MKYLKEDCFILSVFIFTMMATNSQADTIGVPETGVALGLGWNSQTAEIIPNRCIEFAPIEETGQSIEMQISDVSDSSDVAERLNVSASMAIKSKFGSASAKAKFSTSSKVSATSNSILVRASVENGVMFVGPPRPPELTRHAFSRTGSVSRKYVSSDRVWTGENLPREVTLTERARDMLGSGSVNDLKEFQRYCGDTYVSSIYSGAELLAILSFRSSSQSEAKAAKVSAKAAFSAWGASASGSASVGGASQIATTNAETEIEFTQTGGSGGIIPTSTEEFFEKLHALPSEALRGPEFHSMNVSSYTDLPGWPQDISLNVQDESLETILTNYYATLNSINILIDDLRAQSIIQSVEFLDGSINQLDEFKASLTLNYQEKMGPIVEDLKKQIKNLELNELSGTSLVASLEQIARLNRVQQEIQRFRREIYNLLARSHETDQMIDNIIPIWMFWKRDEPSEKELRRNTETIAMEALVGRLSQFSFGRNNPNLIKLYLPTPKEIKTLKEDFDVSTLSLAVDTYIREQSQRICRQNPISPECMSIAELAFLATCVPNEEDVLLLSTDCRLPDDDAR